jgi:hypothetical protein
MASPDRKSFLLRIDPRLWAELEGWAQQDLRSVNGQIEFLLREAVARRRKSTPPLQGRTTPEEGSVSTEGSGPGLTSAEGTGGAQSSPGTP